MPVIISAYAERHLEGIKNLIPSIQQNEFNVPITWDDQPDLHDIPGFYRKGAGEFWVAESAGQVIGTIALIDIGGGDAALRKMFVHQNWRGRDESGKPLGVAQALLSTLIHHAEDKGLKAIYLGTTAVMKGAHRFYEKSGFTEINPHALPEAFPRMAVDSRFYVRHL